MIYSNNNTKQKIKKNKTYKWSELQNLKFSKKNNKIYIENYQDYWIDWSPDSNKIVALAINQNDIGIHILDLTTFTYKLNNQNIFVPFKLITQQSKPLLWKAQILTEPMQQAFPSWCRNKNYIAYGEYSLDFKSSKLIIYDLENDEYTQKTFDILPEIVGIDFSWNSTDLAIYGENKVIIYNCDEKKIIFSWEASSEIEQVSWFPDDDFLFIVYNGKGYQINHKDNKIIPKIIIESASWSKYSFIPGTKEIVMASETGLIAFNYETKKIRNITEGFHYQPQVSPDGKWVSYISEGPLGGFISPLFE